MHEMYNKDRHFKLSGKIWNANKAKAVMQEIATDAISNLSSGYLWPTHPLDDDVHVMVFILEPVA